MTEAEERVNRELRDKVAAEQQALASKLFWSGNTNYVLMVKDVMEETGLEVTEILSKMAFEQADAFMKARNA